MPLLWTTRAHRPELPFSTDNLESRRCQDPHGTGPRDRKRRRRRVTLGPSSGERTQFPTKPITPLEVRNNVLVTVLTQPEYDNLFYIDVEFKDAKEDTWFETRALMDCGSQGSCINQKESQNYLTSHIPKLNPMKMIMADSNFSSVGPITHYDPVQLRIGGSEEPTPSTLHPSRMRSS